MSKPAVSAVLWAPAVLENRAERVLNFFGHPLAHFTLAIYSYFTPILAHLALEGPFRGALLEGPIGTYFSAHFAPKSGPFGGTH